MSYEDYVHAQTAVLAAAGITESPAKLVRRWDSFVESCTDYRWDITEFDDEVRVRDTLELILANDGLDQFSEHQTLSR